MSDWKRDEFPNVVQRAFKEFVQWRPMGGQSQYEEQLERQLRDDGSRLLTLEVRVEDLFEAPCIQTLAQ